MKYSPPDLDDRPLIESPGWLWSRYRGDLLGDGTAHYYDASGHRICERIVCLAIGREANESDAGHVCTACLSMMVDRVDD